MMQSIWCKHQIIYSYPHTFLWFVLFILYAVLIVCIVPACMLPVSCLPLCILVFSFCALCCYACPNYYYIIFFFCISAEIQLYVFSVYLVVVMWCLRQMLPSYCKIGFVKNSTQEAQFTKL